MGDISLVHRMPGHGPHGILRSALIHIAKVSIPLRSISLNPPNRNLWITLSLPAGPGHALLAPSVLRTAARADARCAPHRLGTLALTVLLAQLRNCGTQFSRMYLGLPRIASAAFRTYAVRGRLSDELFRSREVGEGSCGQCAAKGLTGIHVALKTSVSVLQTPPHVFALTPPVVVSVNAFLEAPEKLQLHTPQLC